MEVNGAKPNHKKAYYFNYLENMENSVNSNVYAWTEYSVREGV